MEALPLELSDNEVIEVTGCPLDSCGAESWDPCVDRRGEALGHEPRVLDEPHKARRKLAESIERDIRMAGCLPEHDPEGYAAAWPEGAARLERARKRSIQRAARGREG